jgi:peptidoglycan L-alanyl-D-glutamate endopeptidase CwlK
MQRLFEKVVVDYDCTIICAFRNQADQEQAYRTGMSKKQWPQSKHNQENSRAVDVAPWPIDWEDRHRFYHFGGYVKAVAAGMGLRIRWGGDWDGDFNFKDQNFHDLPHFELLESA